MTFQHKPLRQFLLLFIYFTIPFGYGINKYELSSLKTENDGYYIDFLYFFDVDTGTNTTDNAGITENSRHRKFSLFVPGGVDIAFLGQSQPFSSTIDYGRDPATEGSLRAENHSGLHFNLVTIKGNRITIYPLKKKINIDEHHCSPLFTIRSGQIKKIKGLVGKFGLNTSGAIPARAHAYLPSRKVLTDKFNNLTLSDGQRTGQKTAIDTRKNPEPINNMLSLTFFFDKINDQDNSTACQAGEKKESFILSLFVNSPHTAMLGSDYTGSIANLPPERCHNSEQKNCWTHTDISQPLSAFVINQLKSHTLNLYPDLYTLFLEMGARVNLLQACALSGVQASVPCPLPVAPQQRQTVPSLSLPGQPQSAKNPAIQQATPLPSVPLTRSYQTNLYRNRYSARTYSTYCHTTMRTVTHPNQKHLCSHTGSDHKNQAITPIPYHPK